MSRLEPQLVLLLSLRLIKNFHHIALPVRISLTLSRHPSLSSFALGKSSRLHPVLAHGCCVFVLAGRPTFARPCDGVHSIISLMSSSLLLPQCPACLFRLTWIVFVMSGRWPYNCCLWGVASRTCSIQLATFLCNYRQAFSLYV